uniref:BY PROTMAP: gi/647400189/emb/CDR45454.1/ RHTO0S11e00386g1_1 [Rhodosporidium toruloides] n=1 Tax=Rhodotorula toruloides TaxID=5286 RepID=A0A0K3CAX8_RHOTO
MGWLSRTRSLVWPEPRDPLERSLLRKADALILSYLCLNVSGLGTALHMKGREYNAVIACFTAGFAIAQIPQNLLLLLIPPRYLFPLNGEIVVWGVLTAAGAGATKVQHLYVIKFFQGMAECSTFIGAHYILGSWYHPSEIGRRAALFSASAQIASIFSGSLQSALYTNLDGACGLEGWQWLFIVCGIITVPIALFGIYSFPDTPTRTTSRLFTPQERALAIARLPPPSRAQKRGVGVDWTLVRRVLSRWELWGLALVWIAGGALESYSSWGIMPLWMKAQRTSQGKARYSVAELNHHPLGMPAVAIAALLVTAIWTDRRTKDRYAVNLVVALAVLVSSLIVLISGLKPVGSVPRGAVYFAFYLSAVSFAGQMSNFAWANELLRDDEEARSVVLAGMNVISYAFNAWFQIAFFPASSAPRFTRGSSLMIAFCPLLAVFTGVVRGLQVRTERRRALNVVVEEGKEEKAEEKEGEGKRPGTGTTVVGDGEGEGKDMER